MSVEAGWDFGIFLTTFAAPLELSTSEGYEDRFVCPLRFGLVK